MIRVALSPVPNQQVLDLSLDETGRQLARFRDMASDYDFRPKLYLIHPVQDLIRGTFVSTIEEIESITPEGLTLHSVAPALADEPAKYYYSYNGHLNREGARNVADFLIRLDTGQPDRLDP
jgi:hypothetical protein